MERRKFIKNISLLGLGVLTLPSSVVAAPKQWTVLNLQTQAQVRHGLLNLTSTTVVGASWWETLQKNIFYKNGYEPSEEDLILYSFNYQNNDYLISLKKQVLTIGQGSSSRIFSTEVLGVLHQSDGADLSIELIEKEIFINKNEAVVVIPILPNTKIDNYILQNGEALRISPNNQTITTDKKVIIIKQHF